MWTCKESCEGGVGPLETRRYTLETSDFRTQRVPLTVLVTAGLSKGSYPHYQPHEEDIETKEDPRNPNLGTPVQRDLITKTYKKKKD